MKNITILGGGESGIGAALLAKKKNIIFFYLITDLLKMNINNY